MTLRCHADDLDPPIFNVRALQKLPTLHVSQFDDLKTDDGKERVWLSRRDRQDGACCNAHVTVEQRKFGVWVTTYEECHE